MRNDEDFGKWMSQWEAAQKELDAERPTPQPQVRTSYFNDFPAEYDEGEPNFNDDWNNIYQKSMDNDYSSEGLLTDNYDMTANGKMPQNPISLSSVGNDQEDEDGRTRVTPNWSDGDELRELDDVKKRVEAMERRFHEADVLKKTERTKLQTELTSLRDRVKKLCEKITPDPKKDVS